MNRHPAQEPASSTPRRILPWGRKRPDSWSATAMPTTASATDIQCPRIASAVRCSRSSRAARGSGVSRISNVPPSAQSSFSAP
ncbi:hypothetical protein [Streptomyces sirii]|uniref:hypothetical protein n=1 Tax=Streptomyces sirii TaxID=3127701 RepID=UPI003D35C224